jgi:hypothetical protein
MTGDTLSDCIGYRVETHDGRLGSVAAIVPPRTSDETGVVIVHSGPSCSLSAVSVADVERVDAGRRRLLVMKRSGRLGTRA